MQIFPLNWHYYNDNNCKVLFLHLMLRCNTIQADTITTSIVELAEETGLYNQQVEENLKKLRDISEIYWTGTRISLFITVNRCIYKTPIQMRKDYSIRLEQLQMKYSALPHKDILELWSLKLEEKTPEFITYTQNQLFASLERFMRYYKINEKKIPSKQMYDVKQKDDFSDIQLF